MHPAAAPVEIATGFSRQQVVVRPGDEVANLLAVAQPLLPLIKGLFHLPIILAGAPDLVPALFLQERTRPLGEVSAPMMLGVPRAAVDLDLLSRRKFPAILADV